jgi:hypothetical protein
VSAVSFEPPDPKALWKRIDLLLGLTETSSELVRRRRWMSLATSSGVEYKTLQRWKKGEHTPQEAKVLAVAKALGFKDFHELIAGLPVRARSDRPPDSSPTLPSFTLPSQPRVPESPAPVLEAPPSSRRIQPGSARSPHPYDPTKPVSDPMFAGRSALMRSLEVALEEARSVSLVGDWKAGKSSVLRTWEQRVQGYGYQVVALRGGRIECTAQAFVAEIIGSPVSGGADDGAEALRRWLARRSMPTPPVILADEFDELAIHIDGRFFRRLRGLVEDGAIILVTATTRHLSDLCAKGQTSPFGATLETHLLGLLEPSEAEELLLREQGRFDAEDRELILRFSGCHPYFIKLLANHLIRARRERGTIQMAVERCYDDASRHLLEWWKDLKEKEQAALREICEGGKPAPKLIKSLQGRALVTEAGEPFGDVLSRWMMELSS